MKPYVGQSCVFANAAPCQYVCARMESLMSETEISEVTEDELDSAQLDSTLGFCAHTWADSLGDLHYCVRHEPAASSLFASRDRVAHISLRETAMTIHRPMTYIAPLLLIAFVHPALAQECSSLSTQMSGTQQTLYEYALIAEAAYGPTPTNTCVQERTGRSIGMPIAEKRPLLRREIHSRWIRLFDELWQSDRSARPDSIGRYVGDNGVTYVTCAYDHLVPQFALTWTEYWRTLGDDDAPSRIDVHVEIRPVIPHSMITREGQFQGEEIGIIRLTRDPSSSNGPEELVAIQGTDFTRIPQIMASMRHLLSDSCVYEVAAIVVDVTRGSISNGQLSVVGHSLGGGAVQYIVQDHAQHPWRNPTQGQNANVTFGAYSFNSVGLDSPSASDTDPSSLISYIVDEEIVSWMGEQFGRTQVGTVIRYVPPSAWPDTGGLRFIGDIIQSEQPESVRRHRLPAIQQGLCECINGHGSIVQPQHP